MWWSTLRVPEGLALDWGVLAVLEQHLSSKPGHSERPGVPYLGL